VTKKLDLEHEPVLVRHLEVTPRGGESPERMIKRFSKKVRNEGILQELYQRRGYEKPSVKRRRKAARSRFNMMIANREAQEKK
jgi:small subunit ribosomal protein S21